MRACKRKGTLAIVIKMFRIYQILSFRFQIAHMMIKNKF